MTAEPLSDEALLAHLIAFDTTSHKSNREIADFISALDQRAVIDGIGHLPDTPKGRTTKQLFPSAQPIPPG